MRRCQSSVALAAKFIVDSGRLFLLQTRWAMVCRANASTHVVGHLELVRAVKQDATVQGVDGIDTDGQRVLARWQDLVVEHIQTWIVAKYSVRVHGFSKIAVDGPAQVEDNALDDVLARLQAGQDEDGGEGRLTDLVRDGVVDLERDFVPAVRIALGLLLTEELEDRTARQRRVAFGQVAPTPQETSFVQERHVNIGSAAELATT